MIVRALTGILFIGVIIGSLFWSIHAATIVFSAFMMLGIHEFYGLFKDHEKIEVSPVLGLGLSIILSTIAILSFYYVVPGSLFLLSILPAVFIGLVSEIWRKKKEPLLNSAVLILGFMYVLFPFLALIFMNVNSSQYPEVSVPITLGMFFLIWTNDTFAYLTGKAIGKTKLIERVSPNKTWEGTLGGVFFTLILGATLGYFNNDYLFWIPAAAIIAPCASLGDLFESVLKRNLGIKDSGNILPGHGGILDRFDATLMAVPFFFLWYLIYILYF